MSSPIAGSPSARSRTPPNVCFLIDSSCPLSYQRGRSTKASAEIYVNDIRVSVLRTLLYFYYYVDSRFRWGYQFVHTMQTSKAVAPRVHGFREFREIEFQGFLAELRDAVNERLENAATSEEANGKGETQTPLGIITESLKKGLTDFKWNQVDFLNTNTIISPMKPHTRTARNSSFGPGNGGNSYPPATVKHYTYLFTECPKTFKDLLYHVDGSETTTAHYGHRSYWSQGLELELEGLLDRVQEAWMGKAFWDVYMTERIALSWIDTSTSGENDGHVESDGDSSEITSRIFSGNGYTEIVHRTIQAIMRAYGGTLLNMKDITKAQEVLPYSAMFQYARNKMLEPDRELKLVSTEKKPPEQVKEVDMKNDAKNIDCLWEGQMITVSQQEEAPQEGISISISRLLTHPKNKTCNTFADKLKGRATTKSTHPAQSIFSPSLESIAVISSIPSKLINPLWCTASCPTLSEPHNYLPTSALDPPIFTCTPSKRSSLADKTKFNSMLEKLRITGRVLIVKIEPTDGLQGGAKLAILEPILKAVASLQLMSSRVTPADLAKLAERVEAPGTEKKMTAPINIGVGGCDVPVFRPVLLEKWSSTIARTFRPQSDIKNQKSHMRQVKSFSLAISLPPKLEADENDTSVDSIAQLGNESFSSISDVSFTGCESSNARAGSRAEVDDVQNDLKSIETLLSEFTENYMTTLYSCKTSLIDFVQNTVHELKTGIQSVYPPPEKTALVTFLQTHIFTSLSDIDHKHKYLLSLRNGAKKSSIDSGLGAPTESGTSDDTLLQIDERKEPYLKSWYGLIMHKRCLTDDMLRKKIDGLRAREAQLQIILMLELLQMEVQNPGVIGTAPIVAMECKAKPEENGKRAKKRRSNAEPSESSDLHYRLEMFVDMLCLWFETGAGGLYEDILNSTRSAGDFLQGEDADGLRLFVTKVIDRYYKEGLPDIVAQLHRKCGIDSMYTMSPAKFIRQQSLMEKEEESNRSERLTRARARLPILASKPETDILQPDDTHPAFPTALTRTKSAPVKQRKSRSKVADSLVNFGSRRPGIAINNALFRNREVAAAMVTTVKRKKGTTPKKQKPKSQVLVQNKCNSNAMPSTRQGIHNRAPDHDDAIFRTPGKRQRRTPHRTLNSTASPKIIPQTPTITTPTRSRVSHRTELLLTPSRYPITPRNRAVNASPLIIPQTPCSGRSLPRAGSGRRPTNTPTRPHDPTLPSSSQPRIVPPRRNSVNANADPSPCSQNRYSSSPAFHDRFTVAATPESKSSARKSSVPLGSNRHYDAFSTPRKRKRVVHSDAEVEEDGGTFSPTAKGECNVRRKLLAEFVSQ